MAAAVVLKIFTVVIEFALLLCFFLSCAKLNEHTNTSRANTRIGNKNKI